jgi:hypothetical protein
LLLIVVGTVSQQLTLMFGHPSAQEVSVYSVRQRQFRHRNAGLQTGLDQFALGGAGHSSIGHPACGSRPVAASIL